MKPGLTLLVVGTLLTIGLTVGMVALMASLGGHSLRGVLRCAWKGRHDPARTPHGGFRCRSCRETGSDLGDMGFGDGGYVTPPAVTEARAAVRDTRVLSFAPDVRFYRGQRGRS